MSDFRIKPCPFHCYNIDCILFQSSCTKRNTAANERMREGIIERMQLHGPTASNLNCNTVLNSSLDQSTSLSATREVNCQVKITSRSTLTPRHSVFMDARGLRGRSQSVWGCASAHEELRHQLNPSTQFEPDQHMQIKKCDRKMRFPALWWRRANNCICSNLGLAWYKPSNKHYLQADVG